MYQIIIKKKELISNYVVSIALEKSLVKRKEKKTWVKSS